jgi:hypothetical protein
LTFDDSTLAMGNTSLSAVDVEHSHVRFLGDLVLNLWDCGGQEAFMENYFASQRHNIFRNVAVLIYVRFLPTVLLFVLIILDAYPRSVRQCHICGSPEGRASTSRSWVGADLIADRCQSSKAGRSVCRICGLRIHQCGVWGLEVWEAT